MEGNSQRPETEPSSQDLCEPPLNEENFPTGKVGASVLCPTLLFQTKELSPQDEGQSRKVHAFLLPYSLSQVWFGESPWLLNLETL